MTKERICLPAESVESSILRIRGKKAASNKELTRRLHAQEHTCRERFKIVREVIRQLMKTREPKRNQIGFRAKIRDKKGN